jgi:CheY-like chemotaxis protein
LIVEDDAEAAAYLTKAFREAGHVADHAADGLEGYAMAEGGGYDVLVVDRMLPRLDGLSLIRSLREQNDVTPVLILSALGEVDDRVKGLRAGGDDYLPKPYAFSELLARVEVLNRRASAKEAETVYRVGDLALDRLSHSVARGARDHAAAARIPPARISDEACRPGGDAHHAARKCLGLSFRSADQCHRRACLAPARQDREGLRTPDDPHHSRRGIYGP